MQPKDVGSIIGNKNWEKSSSFFFKSKTSILYKKKGKIYQGDKGYLQKENVYSEIQKDHKRKNLLYFMARDVVPMLHINFKHILLKKK